MRMYVIGVMVGVIGLVAANQVQADEHCGLKSASVLKVQRWNVEKTKFGKYEVEVYLDSMDPKVIKNVSGSIEFFAGKDHILTLPLRFPYQLQLKSHFLQSFERRTLPVPILAKAPDVEAFACVAAINYADGSGVIIN
jgi:hypothetical protein